MRVCLVLIKRRVTSFPGFRTYWSRDSSFVLGGHLLACRLHNEAFVVTDLTQRRSRPFSSQCPTVVPVAVETIRNLRKRSVIWCKERVANGVVYWVEVVIMMTLLPSASCQRLLILKKERMSGAPSLQRLYKDAFNRICRCHFDSE